MSISRLLFYRAEDRCRLLPLQTHSATESGEKWLNQHNRAAADGNRAVFRSVNRNVE